MLGVCTVPAVAAARATPPACTAAAEALQTFSVQFDTWAPGSPQRDPAKLLDAISPDCRRALLDGQWPALASTLLPLAEKHDDLKAAACELAAPEAFSRILEWTRVAVGSDQAWTYDAVCAKALLRYRRADFDRIVEPVLANPPGSMLLALRLAEGLKPEERGVLSSALDAATARKAPGRDELFRLVCGADSARAISACQAPTSLELQWAAAERRRKAAPALAVHFGLALLYAITCALLSRRSRGDALLVALGIAGTSGSSVALAWFVLADPGHGAGEISGISGLLALLVTPVAALAGAVVGWLALRVAKVPALPWCLAQGALYAAVAGTFVWHANGG